jgi:hypothetical protein
MPSGMSNHQEREARDELFRRILRQVDLGESLHEAAAKFGLTEKQIDILKRENSEIFDR